MKKIGFIVLICTVFLSCNDSKPKNEKFSIITTTSMITDLVQNIGGDKVNVEGLMGAGVDPHLYKASEGDVSKLFNADMIIYNGLHLEGKLVEVFENMERQNINTVAISDALDKKELISSALFASNDDPHIWFNIDYCKQITVYITRKLSEAQP